MNVRSPLLSGVYLCVFQFLHLYSPTLNTDVILFLFPRRNLSHQSLRRNSSLINSNPDSYPSLVGVSDPPFSRDLFSGCVRFSETYLIPWNEVDPSVNVHVYVRLSRVYV